MAMDEATKRRLFFSAITVEEDEEEEEERRRKLFSSREARIEERSKSQQAAEEQKEKNIKRQQERKPIWEDPTLTPEEQSFWQKMQTAETEQKKPFLKKAWERLTSKEEWKKLGTDVKEFFVGKKTPEDISKLSPEELEKLSPEEILKFKPEEIQMDDEQYISLYGGITNELIETNRQIASIEEEISKTVGKRQTGELPYRDVNRDMYEARQQGITLEEYWKKQEEGGKEFYTLEKQEQQDALRKQLENYKDLSTIYRQFLGQESIRRGAVKSAVGKLEKDPIELLPFIGDVKSLSNFLEQYSVLKKYQENPEELNDTEWSQIRKLQGDILKKYMKAGVGDSVGEMVVEMPKFMIEFALTGNLAEAGQEVAEKGLKKMGGEAAEETLETMAKRKLIQTVEEKAGKEILEEIGEKTLKETAYSIIKSSVGSLVRLNVAFIPQIANKTAEYILPEYDLVGGENGDIILKKIDSGDDFATALSKAYLTTYLDIATEDLGVIVEDGGDFLKRSILGKYATKTGIKTLTELEQVAAKVGWNGIIGEVFEEEISELAQAPIESRKYYDPFTTPEGRERLLTETLGIAAFSGISQASADTLSKLDKVADKRSEYSIDITEGVKPIKEPEITPVVTEEGKVEVEEKGIVPEGGKAITEEIKPKEVEIAPEGGKVEIKKKVTPIEIEKGAEIKISEKDELKAEEDWTDNYAEKYQELETKLNESEKELGKISEAKKWETKRTEVQEQIDTISSEQGKMEEEWINKWTIGKAEKIEKKPITKEVIKEAKIPTYAEAQRLIPKEGGYANAKSLPAVNRMTSVEIASALNLNPKYLYEQATKKGIALHDYMMEIDRQTTTEKRVAVGERLLDVLSEEKKPVKKKGKVITVKKGKLSLEEAKKLNDTFVKDAKRVKSIEKKGGTTYLSPDARKAKMKLNMAGYKLSNAKDTTLGFNLQEKKPTITKKGQVEITELGRESKVERERMYEKKGKERVSKKGKGIETTPMGTAIKKSILEDNTVPMPEGKDKVSKEEIDASISQITEEMKVGIEMPKGISAVESEEYATGYEYIRTGMGYPNWIPTEYRQKSIVQKALDALFENESPKRGTKAAELYKIAVQEAKERVGDIYGLSTRTAFATKEGKRIGEFEKRIIPKEGTGEFKLNKKIQELIKKYAERIGEGYLPRNTLGVYYPETKNIRVNALNNVSAVTHEVAHFLDDALDITSRIKTAKITGGQSIRELNKLYMSYYPKANASTDPKLKLIEGYATLLQKYVEMPETIKKEYPHLVEQFIDKDGRYYNTVIDSVLSDIENIIVDYQSLKAIDKIGARVTSEKTNIDKESFLNFFEKLRTQLVDQCYPVEVLAKKAGVLFTKEDPSLWLRAFSSINGIIANNINTNNGYWTLNQKGDFTRKYDYNWKTIIDGLQKRKMTDTFGNYLIARKQYFDYEYLNEIQEELNDLKSEVKKLGIVKSSITKLSTGENLYKKYLLVQKTYTELGDILKKDGFTREEVNEAYNSNKDLFKEEEKMFDTLTREDLLFLNHSEVQLLTKEQLNKLDSKKGYASFKRQFYDDIVGEDDTFPAQARVGKTRISSLLHRKGSMKTIIHPLFSAIANHNEIIRKGARQIVYNKIGNIGISAILPNLFQEQELKASVDTVTGVVKFPQEKDPNIIMARQDYKRKPILVDKSVKEIVDSILDHKNIDAFTKFYVGLSRMFTAGTTGLYAPFAATNFLVDQITAQSNTTNKYKFLYTPLKEIGEVILNKQSDNYKYYQEYMTMGGERQTFSGWQKLAPKDLFKIISNEKKGLDKITKLLDKGTDLLSTPSKYSEIMSRASEYIRSRKVGKSQVVALEEAGRVTAPFHHMGKWGGQFMQTFIRGLPFFNASLQVLDQTIRTAETPQGRKRLTFVTLAVTAAYIASLTAMMGASDDQKEQYKDLQPEELTNYIYLPNPNGKGLIRIKQSQTFSLLGTIINMIIGDNVFKTDYDKRNYIEALTAWIPDQFNITEPTKVFLAIMPQIFKTGAEVIMNKKTYPKVLPLESEYLQQLPPGMRTNEGTSKFAKWLGKTFNMSPIKIDYLITGYFGRATGYFTGKPDAYNPASQLFRDYYFTMGRRISNYYDIKEDNDQIYKTLQDGTKTYSSSEQEEIYRKRIITDEISKKMKEYKAVDVKKDQVEAMKLRKEILILIEQLYSKEIPDDYSKWVDKAKERKKKKITQYE